MKTKIFTLLATAVFVISAQHVQAKVRRVGYPGKPVPGTDFSSLQMAVDSSAAKDSIYIFPGTYLGNYGSYGSPAGVAVYKRLVFEGYGSPMGDSSAQVNVGTSTILISLFPGADSSIFEGLDGLCVWASEQRFAYTTPGGTTINGGVVNNITVRRCHTNLIQFNDVTLNGWTITQSFVDIVPPYGPNYIGSGNPNGGIEGGGGQVTNLNISNCIIYGIKFDNVGSGYSTIEQAAAGFLTNNIFFGYQSPYGDNVGTGVYEFNNAAFIAQNNIFVDIPGLVGTGSFVWQNNITTQADIPLTNGNGSATNNKQNVSDASIFVGFPTQGNYSSDGRFALASGSAAKGAGVGGVDCGIFGGATPFKPDCVPALPAFFKLSAPSTNATANPYTITFSVRSNN